MSVTNSLDKPEPFRRDLNDTFEVSFLRERIWKKKVTCFKRVYCQTPGTLPGTSARHCNYILVQIPCS